jgi:DNA (cytosine-5)-methyltransferase 1
VTGLDRHGLVEPTTLRVEDCYFRMLQPHEIGAAMAFPADYEVGGTKRDRVKQYGNAVTPP